MLTTFNERDSLNLKMKDGFQCFVLLLALKIYKEQQKWYYSFPQSVLEKLILKFILQEVYMLHNPSSFLIDLIRFKGSFIWTKKRFYFISVILCTAIFALTVNGRLELGLVMYFFIGVLVQLRYTKYRVPALLLAFFLSAVSEFMFVCIMHNFAFSRVIKDIFITGFRNSAIILAGILAAYLLNHAIRAMRNLKLSNIWKYMDLL